MSTQLTYGTLTSDTRYCASLQVFHTTLNYHRDRRKCAYTFCANSDIGSTYVDYSDYIIAAHLFFHRSHRYPDKHPTPTPPMIVVESSLAPLLRQTRQTLARLLNDRIMSICATS